MLSVMPSRYALVTFASILIISESVYKETDCSQLGNYTLRTRLRTKFATQIINGVYRDDVYNPLDMHGNELLTREVQEARLADRNEIYPVYQCFLEGLAALILENPGKPSQLECPFSVAALPLDFEMVKAPGLDINVMIAAAFAQWERFLRLMTPANNFGCNYAKKGRRYKFLCLFIPTVEIIIQLACMDNADRSSIPTCSQMQGKCSFSPTMCIRKSLFFERKAWTVQPCCCTKEKAQRAHHKQELPKLFGRYAGSPQPMKSFSMDTATVHWGLLAFPK